MTSTGVRPIVVQTPGISVNSTAEVGAGLQAGLSASLGASQHGGVDVTITSSAPSLVLVSPDAATAGTSSIVVPMTNGATSFSFYVQGLENTGGTGVVTLSAPGFTSATVTVTVRPPGLEIVGLPATIGAGDASATGWYVQVGIPYPGDSFLWYGQSVRAGSPGFVVTLTNTDGDVAQLTSDEPAAAGQIVSKPIEPGYYYTQAAVAGTSYGLLFDPLGAGTTTVAVSAPGAITMTGTGVRTVAVTGFDFLPAPETYSTVWELQRP
jgi:hypothetical protein